MVGSSVVFSLEVLDCRLSDIRVAMLTRFSASRLLFLLSYFLVNDKLFDKSSSPL